MNSLSKRISGIKFITKEVKSSNVVFPSGISFSNRDFASTDTKWIEEADTTNLTTLQSAFSYTKNLDKLDLSKWNISNVTTLSYMFSNSSIKTLTLNNWKTEKVTQMLNMFQGCLSLTTLDICNWSNQNLLQNMSAMFSDCINLQNIDLKNFNTSNVTNMENTFYGCGNITTLDLSSFDTSNVTSMYQMFNSCTKLTHIEFGENFSLVKCSTSRSLQSILANTNNLDNQTLNEFLKVLLTATSFSENYRRLNYVMNTTLAQKCSSLSNWTLLEEAGWTIS